MRTLLFFECSARLKNQRIEFFTGPTTKFSFVNAVTANMSDIMNLAYAKRIRYLDGDTEMIPGVRTCFN